MLEKSLFSLYPNKSNTDNEQEANKIYNKFCSFIKEKERECEIIKIQKFISFSDDSNDYIFINKNPRNKFSLLPEVLTQLKTIFGYDFEKLCFVILLKNGFQEVKLTKLTRDKAIDLYAFLHIEKESIIKRKIFEKDLYLLIGEAKTKKPKAKIKPIGYEVVLKIIGAVAHFMKKPKKYLLIDDEINPTIKPYLISNAEFSDDSIEYANDMEITLFNRFLVGTCIIESEIACYSSENNWVLNIEELNEIYKKDLDELKSIYLKDII
ncbi:MAG: restriction endonuclease [Candidatus Heimdallarchaeota archaeon]|nr:restriction endonuclease [Candidatus Heimdallarchaeota archaeon]